MRFECGPHLYSAGTVRAPAQCGFFGTLLNIWKYLYVGERGALKIAMYESNFTHSIFFSFFSTPLMSVVKGWIINFFLAKCPILVLIVNSIAYIFSISLHQLVSNPRLLASVHHVICIKKLVINLSWFLSKYVSPYCTIDPS